VAAVVRPASRPARRARRRTGTCWSSGSVPTSTRCSRRLRNPPVPEPDFIHFRPGLADSFSFSDDSLQVSFHIHPGITWHDGEPFTADDVVFAISVCRAPEINYSAVSWLDHISNVEAVDSLTVRFTYDERYMYQVVDAVVCYPLPEHILGDVPFGEMANHPIARAPVGNGPFRFVSWSAGQEVVLEANPDFVLGRPHLNRVTYRIVPEVTNLATQIQNGEVDVFPRFTPPPCTRSSRTTPISSSTPIPAARIPTSHGTRRTRSSRTSGSVRR
jgi:ABC-type transport system substrate-binding protein